MKWINTLRKQKQILASCIPLCSSGWAVVAVTGPFPCEHCVMCTCALTWLEERRRHLMWRNRLTDTHIQLFSSHSNVPAYLLGTEIKEDDIQNHEDLKVIRKTCFLHLVFQARAITHDNLLLVLVFRDWFS